MTPFERDLAEHLHWRVYGMSSNAARIVAAILFLDGKGDPVSDRQITALLQIAHRFRRQLPDRLAGPAILFHSDLLAGQSAGGGMAVSAAAPRAGNTHEPNRPNPAHPATPLQGRDIHEGLPLWSRVSA
ncbi:hypothetical protein [Ferrovibrio sp.]|uniref:hypothetical protein n=1 Tax=Ferrovibrio sp. TaxID=1917215 RepID=UPI0035B07FD2